MSTLKFIVLKCKDIEESREFYERWVGLKFAKEKHGSEHYAAELEGGIVFELYPMEDNHGEGPEPGDEKPTFGFDIKHDINPEFEDVFMADPDGNLNMLKRK